MGVVLKLSLLILIIALAFTLFQRFTASPLLPPRGYVLLTGSSSGIGLESAQHLASIGYNVFAAVRKQSDIDELIKLSKNASYKGKLIPIILDVTNRQHRENAFKEISSKVGESGLRALINNAGAFGTLTPLEVKEDSEYEEIMNINFFSPVYLTKKFLPLLIQAKGTVIHVSSPSGYLPTPLFGSYGASKAALDLWGRGLNREFKDVGIYSVTLNVATVVSKMTESAAKAGKDLIDASSAWPQHYKRVAYAMSKMTEYGMDQKGNNICPPSVVAEKLEEILSYSHPSSYYSVANQPPFWLQIIPDDLSAWIFWKLADVMFGEN